MKPSRRHKTKQLNGSGFTTTSDPTWAWAWAWAGGGAGRAEWGDDLPIQRCTLHKHPNLLAHAPEHVQDDVTEDYRDMIYAGTADEVEAKRKAFLRKWRLKCSAVADSLEEAGERLFTFTRLHPSQWKSARRTNTHRTPQRRILPSDQGADRAGVSGNHVYAALGLVGIWAIPFETIEEPIGHMTLDLVA